MGDSFSVAWRTLDAQYWGVPQRRKRIFLVADFGGHAAGKVLFEREGLSWDFGESQQKKQRTAGSAEEGSDSAERAVIPLDYHPNDSRIGIKKDEIVQTLTGRMGTGGGKVPLILEKQKVFGIGAYNSKGMLSDNPSAGFYETDISRTIDCKGGNPTCNQGGMVICERRTYAMQAFGDYIESDVSSTIKARDAKDATDLVVTDEWRVRRLTPLECGRLQGFPDDWTDNIEEENPSSSDIKFWQRVWAEHWSLVGRAKGAKLPKDEKAVRRWLKKPTTDSELYKMWGNGIALPCALYVFEGIVEVMRKEASNDLRS